MRQRDEQAPQRAEEAAKDKGPAVTRRALAAVINALDPCKPALCCF